jgi:hypothetical protein
MNVIFEHFPEFTPWQAYHDASESFIIPEVSIYNLRAKKIASIMRLARKKILSPVHNHGWAYK